MAAVTIQRALIGSCRLSAMPPAAKAPTTASSVPSSLFFMPPSPARSGEQLLQRPAVARHDGVAMAVPSALEHLHSASPHTVDGAPPGRKDPAVDELIAAALEQRRMPGCECDHIDGSARHKARGGILRLQHPVAAGQRAIVQAATGPKTRGV